MHFVLLLQVIELAPKVQVFFLHFARQLVDDLNVARDALPELPFFTKMFQPT